MSSDTIICYKLPDMFTAEGSVAANKQKDLFETSVFKVEQLKSELAIIQNSGLLIPKESVIEFSKTFKDKLQELASMQAEIEAFIMEQPQREVTEAYLQNPLQDQ